MDDRDDDFDLPESGVFDAASADLVFDTEAEVCCPSCGESVVIGLDPGGGATQDYVEDCQVCCSPWRVRIAYDESGAATVRIEPS